MTPRRWVLLGVVAALIAVVVLLRGTSGNDSPEHSSASDAGNGTSALRYYAQALGHNTGTVEGEFDLPSSPALLFIFSPTTGFSSAEAQRLNGWLSSGNVVVYAAEPNRIDPQLDQQFGLHRSRGSVDALRELLPDIKLAAHSKIAAVAVTLLLAGTATSGPEPTSIHTLARCPSGESGVFVNAISSLG